MLVMLQRGKHAVAKYDSEVGYSVGSIGDLNDDRSIGASDYQIFVNMALNENNTEETADDIVTFTRADIDGDRGIDVLDIAQVWRLYFGFQKLDVYGRQGVEALAKATLCCSPPDNCLGFALYLPAKPTTERIDGTFLRISLVGT